MSYEKVIQAKEKVIGTKQTLKALENNQVKEVIVAEDADEKILREVISLAEEKGVPYITVDSKKKLGAVCGLNVNAATVAIKK